MLLNEDRRTDDTPAVEHAVRQLQGRVRGIGSAALDMVAARRAREIDDVFFSQHPSRNAYFRIALDGEFAEAKPARDWLAAVRRVGDGRYARFPLYCPNDRALPEMPKEVAVCLALLVTGQFDKALCGGWSNSKRKENIG